MELFLSSNRLQNRIARDPLRMNLPWLSIEGEKKSSSHENIAI
jgi:hypothetical protein